VYSDMRSLVFLVLLACVTLCGVSQSENPQMDHAELDSTSLTSQLLRFIRLQDIVLCDFDEDGNADILAINQRISTGYGFQGLGNGIFLEGPSFDLPFLPTAVASIGNPLNNDIVLTTSGGSIALFHPLVSSYPPSEPSTSIQIIPIGGDDFSTTFSVVKEETGSAEVYALSNGCTNWVGEYELMRMPDVKTWYDEVLSWQRGAEAVPLPPLEFDRKIRIADFNGDAIMDVVFAGGRLLTFWLSDGPLPLATSSFVNLSIDAQTFRLADVDGNGQTDVVVLSDNNMVEVCLVGQER